MSNRELNSVRFEHGLVPVHACEPLPGRHRRRRVVQLPSRRWCEEVRRDEVRMLQGVRRCVHDALTFEDRRARSGPLPRFAVRGAVLSFQGEVADDLA